ncbi:hypothetical protein [Flavobacterium sp.]|uniref:HYC_CC_PP family protein n=1 Tax=Flavobacterium sp. TaxID=239 RepID=UPI0025D9386F|nr:hypothetical protein [Flavobacterium sp.]
MVYKKHISFLLTFFLLVSSLGLAFNVHYCGKEIASITLTTVSAVQNAEKNCCGEIGKDSKCCKNKIIKSETKSDQIIVKSLSFNANYTLNCNDCKPLFFASNFNFKTRENNTYYCDANAPPFYLLYSQYTFYA